MTEIPDTFWGGEGAKIKTPIGRPRGGKVWGGDVPITIPSPSDYGIYLGWGASYKLPQRGLGQSPSRKLDLILCVLSSTEHICDGQKRENDQLLELQHIFTLNRDKFRTGFGIRDNSASRMTLYFFGTGPQNSGLSRKIRDGWSP